jgi:hypothetical protein
MFLFCSNRLDARGSSAVSIEFSVLSDRRLNSTAEWQQAIGAEGFPLRLDPTCELAQAGGFFPAHFGDKLTGFECFHDDAGELIDQYTDIDFGHRWRYALGLRIGGDYDELRAAFMAAAAYARATGGVVWDGESGEVMSPDRAADEARQIDADAPKS